MNHIDVDFDDFAREHEALRDFGFDESFARSFLALAAPGDEPGRVVEAQRGRYRAACALPLGDDEPEGGGTTKGGGAKRLAAEIEAVPGGSLEGLPPPVTGDWVVLRDADGSWGRAVARAVLPRRSSIVRKAPGDTAYDRVESQALVANVDMVFIVMAAGHDWNPRRLERYMALAKASGAEPVVVMSKADLADDPEALEAEAAGIARDAKRVLVCAPEGRGLERLAGLLGPGKTAVLLGSSGAGKSTIVNALAGEGLARVNAVREDDQRGRHTTTSRQLYRLGSGAMIIDTPGLRELQLWADEETVNQAFPEIEELASSCRFRDCSHRDEPGCAVRAALESGELDAGRYASWRKLAREAAFLMSRENGSLQRDEERRWKIINKQMRGYSKERRSIQGRAR